MIGQQRLNQLLQHSGRALHDRDIESCENGHKLPSSVKSKCQSRIFQHPSAAHLVSELTMLWWDSTAEGMGDQMKSSECLILAWYSVAGLSFWVAQTSVVLSLWHFFRYSFSTWGEITFSGVRDDVFLFWEATESRKFSFFFRHCPP